MLKLTKKSIILYAISGAGVSCITVLLTSVTIYPWVRDSFILPNIIVVFGIKAILGAVAGGLIGLLSRTSIARISGFLGIALGVIWQLHFAVLMIFEEYNEELGTFVLMGRTGGNPAMRLLESFESFLSVHGGIFSDVFVVSLPVLFAILGIVIANLVIRDVIRDSDLFFR